MRVGVLPGAGPWTRPIKLVWSPAFTLAAVAKRPICLSTFYSFSFFAPDSLSIPNPRRRAIHSSKQTKHATSSPFATYSPRLSRLNSSLNPPGQLRAHGHRTGSWRQLRHVSAGSSLVPFGGRTKARGHATTSAAGQASKQPQNPAKMTDREILPDYFKPVHYDLEISELDFANWTYKGRVR
jgi:hypothetical protein